MAPITKSNLFATPLTQYTPSLLIPSPTVRSYGLEGVKLRENPTVDAFVSSGKSSKKAESVPEESKREVDIEETEEYQEAAKKEKERRAKKEAWSKEVVAHEEAHQKAGGNLASSPVYEKDSEGDIVAGHVNIAMPQFDESDPLKTKRDAETVKKAAIAPQSFSTLSDADHSVAASAQATLDKANKTIEKKKETGEITADGRYAPKATKPADVARAIRTAQAIAGYQRA